MGRATWRVLPPSPLQVEEPPICDGSWSSLHGRPVWQWLLRSAHTEEGCLGDSQQAAQHRTSLPHSGCLEQESNHATGHAKNTVEMAAAQQLATHPGPV